MGYDQENAERRKFFDGMREAYAEIAANPKLKAKEDAFVRSLDATLTDGLTEGGGLSPPKAP